MHTHTYICISICISLPTYLPIPEREKIIAKWLLSHNNIFYFFLAYLTSMRQPNLVLWHQHCKRQVSLLCKVKDNRAISNIPIISPSNFPSLVPSGRFFKSAYFSFSVYGWAPLVQTWLLLGLYFPLLCLFSGLKQRSCVCSEPLKAWALRYPKEGGTVICEFSIASKSKLEPRGSSVWELERENEQEEKENIMLTVTKKLDLKWCE